ncbi:unnamed protein product [Vicia faba]|uniref:Uncharacterized protein n=1 Tax=Vicia faba TaxID=3906 RepID=A0AAV1ABX7_VICFA|nr:unnamed protein product [Vicia faba]
MARPFEMISDINDRNELWEIAVKKHHKWMVTTAPKEHFEMVVPSDLMFKPTNHKFLLKFTSGTTIGDIGKHDITDKLSSLTPFVDIILGKWQRNILCDVIGVIDDVGYTQLHAGGKNLRSTWCCTVWEITL